MLEFSTLYATYGRDVFRFALFLSGDPALAEDIASETFTRAWAARERVDLSTVKGYLFAIARNLFLHERRRPGGRTVVIDETLVSEEPSPERAAAARRELEVVLAELQSLSEIDRAALVMRAEDGLPYEEIAGVLGVSLAAVKVKIHRARLQLERARQQSRIPAAETQS
ncbi:MAG: sigma-70 family RNA polymerase sigma factor [Acidobacteriota bacterium]